MDRRNGNRTQMVDLAGTNTYQYDPLYRLTQVTYPTPQTDTYTYDAVGNRLTKNATSYTYDAADQLTDMEGTSFDYDDNGNQASAGSDTFEYDHENRLVESVIDSVTSTSVYNGDGLRMSHTVGQTTTSYIWDIAAGLPVVLQDGTNTYVYGLDLISATDGQGDQTHFLYDGLGSTTDMTDGSGNVTASYRYDVFGALRTGSPGATEWLFTGEQRDSESGLYYLRARYYDPAIGRFLSRDPLSGSLDTPQTQNRYPFVRNNPVRYIDPYGLAPWDEVGHVIGDIVDCANDPKECAEDAGEEIKKGGQRVGDFFTEKVPQAANSAGAVLDDLGYVDVNFTGCIGVCFVGGFQASFGEGFHPYGGTGVGWGAAFNATVAPGQHITTGWNCGFQYTPWQGLSPTVQVGTAGYHFKEGQFKQSAFGEVGFSFGAGYPASYTCIYIP